MDLSTQQVESACRVCGDKARGLNFDVVTCMSCKAFFRRNALSKKIYSCSKQFQCDVTKQTRAQCLACRLRKCYLLGMNPRLLFVLPEHIKNDKDLEKFIEQRYKQLQIKNSAFLYELRSDSTILSNDQWTLISNVIRSYDEFDQINRLQQLFRQKNSQLPKLRTKPRDTMMIFNEIIIGIQPLMERSVHFQLLPKDVGQRIFVYNLAITGGINAMFISREAHISDDITYTTICKLTYGQDFFDDSRKVENRLENNGNLVKLYLFVLIFSTYCKFLSYTPDEDVNMETNSIELFHTQNIYVETLWRYMIYLYGYQQAASRFTRLVTDTLCMISMAKRVTDQSAQNMLVESLVTHIEGALNLASN